MTIDSNRTVALLGGTFDPIHNGHIQIALYALNTLPISEVQLLPCYQPVHKQKTIANDMQRVAMLALAITNQPQLSINLHEIDSKKPCYTIDTLKQLYKPTQPMCFLLGMDAWLSLTSWKDWQQLTDYAHLVIFARPGYQMSAISALQPHLTQEVDAITRNVTSTKPGSILFQTMTDYPIAASTLRECIMNGKNCQQHLPSAVLDYILTHNVYQ